MAENQEEILEEEEKRLAEEAEKRKREEAAAEAQNLKFRTKDDVYEGFAYLTQNKYGEASEEEIKEFIRHKNAYIVAHPEEAEEIAKHIKTEMYSKEEKIYGNDLYYISADFPDKYTKALNKLLRSDNTEDLIAKYENTPQDNVNDEPIDEPLTVEMHAGQDEKSRVPNLAQSLTELGYNNAEITDKLNEVIDRLPDGRKKEMYTKVRDAYVTRNGIVALNDLLVNEKDVAIAKEIVGTLGYEGQDSVFPYPEMEKHIEPFVAPAPTPEPKPYPFVTPTPTPPGPVVTPTPIPEVEEIEVLGRLRSPYSDRNDYQIDRVSYEILVKMGKIKNELTEEQLNDENLLYNTINKAKSSLSNKEFEKFNVEFVDFVVDHGIIGIVPPTVLTQAYEVYGEQYKKAKNEEEKNNFQTKREIVAAQIDNLINQYYTGVANITRDNFNYDDNTNIADVYDGYKEMIEKRRPDVDQEMQEKIKAVDAKLEKDIGEYDGYWGIENITKDNIDQVRKNHKTLTEKMANIALDDETMQMLGNIRFHDENGNIPQFINPETNEESVTWQKGFTIKQNSQLETMVDFARNNTIIENLANDVKSLTDEDLRTSIANRVKIQAFAWDGAEENVKGAIEDYKRYTNPEFLEAFKTRMMDPNRPLNISKKGFDAAVRLSVNETMGAINRISKISGPKDDMLKRIHKPIAKYDPRASSRFGNNGEFKVNWLKTAGWTFAASLGQKLATYGVTLGAVKAASALGLTSATPAVAMTAALPVVAGVTAMAMSGFGMYMNYQNYQKEAKAAGKKPEVKEFFTKQPYATTNIASLFGFAAGACLITGNVPAATAFGVGCLTVAGYGTYKDAKAHGLSKGDAIWQAVKKSSAIGFGGIAGSYVGSLLGITPASVQKGGKTPDQVTKGPDSHDYSATERAHATNRLDDPRFSEFLNRFHVAHDLQDSSDPNKVSADVVANLRASIDNAIHATGDDRSFFTDVAGDARHPNYVANTDMLGYKFEQLAYLAPNPDTQLDPAFASAHHLPQGTTIGEYLSFKAPDGSMMNYMDALREVVTTGKSSNPLGFAEMLGKIDNTVGGQIDDTPGLKGVLINDAGKVPFFGSGPEVQPVQSFKADADVGFDIGHHETVVPGKQEPDVTIPGDKLWGFGYWEPVKGLYSGLKKRAGAIADKIVGFMKKRPQPDVIPVEQPPVKDGKKPYVKLVIEVKEPQVDIKKLLDDEYKIVYGVAPSPTSEVSYKKLVMEEFKADREAGTTKAENLAQYLTERKATYDEKLTQTVDPLAETKGYHETKQGQEATAQARQEMFQTNLSFNGEELPRNQMTLQKFTRFATFALSNGADRGNVTAAHDNSIAASKKERPSDGRFDVGTGKVSGQTTNGGKGVKDGKTGSLQNPKGKGRE